jgi:hypothetical protein
LKNNQEKVKEKGEKLINDKCENVRKIKEDIIRNEIIKIGAKDIEARKLEKKEK